MFTGKNKENFEKWYKGLKRIKKTPIRFEVLPFSMQQGVYLEYLDSVGVNIFIGMDYGWTYAFYLNGVIIGCIVKLDVDTRQEALKEAFKKADELINKI